MNFTFYLYRTTKRAQTFYDGAPDSPEGVCHLPMYPAYCEETRQLLIDTLRQLGFKHHENGTCIAVEGPRFSSRAESNMFRAWGADVINMTAVPEVRNLCVWERRGRGVNYRLKPIKMHFLKSTFKEHFKKSIFVPCYLQ